jgi:hypothetical protein
VTELGVYLKQVRIVVKRYVNGNWGFPFIAGFMVLLFSAAVLLTVKDLASMAEPTATLAYIALVVGVVLQLVCSGRNNQKKGAVFHGSG